MLIRLSCQDPGGRILWKDDEDYCRTLPPTAYRSYDPPRSVSHFSKRQGGGGGGAGGYARPYAYREDEEYKRNMWEVSKLVCNLKNVEILIEYFFINLFSTSKLGICYWKKNTC